jgi:hypothetical protein
MEHPVPSRPIHWVVYVKRSNRFNMISREEFYEEEHGIG